MLLNKNQAERILKLRNLMGQIHAHFMGEWAELRRRRLELRKGLQEKSDKRKAEEILSQLQGDNSQP
jgi:hypothetical protein